MDPTSTFWGGATPAFTGRKRWRKSTREISARAESLSVEVDFFQSNSEGSLIDRIQQNWGRVDGIIINPGALTHYGYSLKDALIDAAVPVVEVHLGNIHAREEWRRRSVIADTARGQIAGFGWRSYTAAVEVMAGILADEAAV